MSRDEVHMNESPEFRQFLQPWCALRGTDRGRAHDRTHLPFAHGVKGMEPCATVENNMIKHRLWKDQPFKKKYHLLDVSDTQRLKTFV